VVFHVHGHVAPSTVALRSAPDPEKEIGLAHPMARDVDRQTPPDDQVGPTAHHLGRHRLPPVPVESAVYLGGAGERGSQKAEDLFFEDRSRLGKHGHEVGAGQGLNRLQDIQLYLLRTPPGEISPLGADGHHSRRFGGHFHRLPSEPRLLT
jgi:hypothetical protein